MASAPELRNVIRPLGLERLRQERIVLGVASIEYGVAPHVQVVTVSMEQITEDAAFQIQYALEEIVLELQANKSGNKTVVILPELPLDLPNVMKIYLQYLVRKLRRLGGIAVQPARNTNTCEQELFTAQEVIRVGATNKKLQVIAGAGPCVHLFAGGEWQQGTSERETASTVAAARVAGVLSAYMASGHTSESARAAVMFGSTPGVVTNIVENSVNRFIYLTRNAQVPFLFMLNGTRIRNEDTFVKSLFDAEFNQTLAQVQFPPRTTKSTNELLTRQVTHFSQLRVTVPNTKAKEENFTVPAVGGHGIRTCDLRFIFVGVVANTITKRTLNQIFAFNTAIFLFDDGVDVQNMNVTKRLYHLNTGVPYAPMEGTLNSGSVMAQLAAGNNVGMAPRATVVSLRVSADFIGVFPMVVEGMQLVHDTMVSRAISSAVVILPIQLKYFSKDLFDTYDSLRKKLIDRGAILLEPSSENSEELVDCKQVVPYFNDEVEGLGHLVVGAINEKNEQVDSVADCPNLFAPAGPLFPGQPNGKTGRTMAATAITAGVAANYLSQGFSAKETYQLLISTSLKWKITIPRAPWVRFNNRMVFLDSKATPATRKPV
jgi:hypothetical protein